jgi:RNA polymerase sigma factor (sigma-70 family)
MARPDGDATDDRELLSAWHAGDLAAGSELFDRHVEMLVADLGDTPEAEELVAEVFVRLSHRPPRCEPPASVRELLRAIVREVQATDLRRRYRLSLAAANRPLAPTRYADRSQRRLLLTLVRVPMPERRILELHVWEGLSPHELATVLGVDFEIACVQLRAAIAAWQAVL